MAWWAAVSVTVAALVWVATIVAAPILLSHGATLPVLLVYQAGSFICHQLPDRSFHLAGVQMPVCARCTGLYVSGAIGACLALIGLQPTVGDVRRWFAIAALPTLLSVGAEWGGLVHPSGIARALLGFPLGALTGWWIVHALRSQALRTRPLAQMRYHS